MEGDERCFIMKLKHLTFKEALDYLGINKSADSAKRESIKHRNRRELIEAFRKWENEYYGELALNYRVLNRLMGSFKTMEEVTQPLTFNFVYSRDAITIKKYLNALEVGEKINYIDIVNN